VKHLIVDPYASFNGLSRTSVLRFTWLGPSSSTGTDFVVGTVS
jgi:hypothetical protein